MTDELPKPYLQVGYYRRGRQFGLRTLYGTADIIPEFRLKLPDLLKLAKVTREEALAALAEAEAPEKIDERIDTESAPDFDAIRMAGIPDDLTGKTVLDIGGYDGEFAEVCLKRGAAEAIVFDSGEYTDYGWAKPLVREGVQFQRGNLMDFGWRAPKPADVVLLYNVIYHIRDPWSALERVRLLTRETLVLCTSFVDGDEPSWQLFAADDRNEQTINETYTVFWRPTIPGLLKLLRLTGFRDIEEVGRAGDHVVVRCH